MEDIKIKREDKEFLISTMRTFKLPGIKSDFIVGKQHFENSDAKDLKRFIATTIDFDFDKSRYGYSLIRNLPTGKEILRNYITWEKNQIISLRYKVDKKIWYFYDEQHLEVEGDESINDSVPYADGIKLFYHYFKSFETYCDKYIPKEFWDTVIDYKIFVNNIERVISAKYMRQIEEEGYILEYIETPSEQRGYKEVKIKKNKIKILEEITERTWYNEFKKYLPKLEEEYKKLVEEGKIDESDVVIYEE